MAYEIVRAVNCARKATWGCVLLILFGLSLNVYAGASDSLDTPLAQYKETGRNRGLFYFCSTVIRMPCGREMFPFPPTDGPPQAPPLLDITSTTPKIVLDQIVSQLPNARWELRDGVVNVEPRQRDREDLLSRRVGFVLARRVPSIRVALDLFEDAGIPVSYQEMGHARQFGLIDLDLKDVSVREALNAIAKADGQLMWLFSHSANPDSPSKGTLTFFSERKSGGAFFGEERKKTKRWKREHGEKPKK